MEQEKIHNTDNDSVENQATTISKQELSEQVDQQFDKIAKHEKWGGLLCFAVIILNLWLSLTNTFEPRIGCKLILFSVFALLLMIKSVIDISKIKKLKNTISRKEQLEGVLRSRKYQLMSKWIVVIYMILYVLIDFLYDRSMGTLVGGILFVILFSIIYLTSYEKTNTFERSEKLEDDLRQLIYMEN